MVPGVSLLFLGPDFFPLLGIGSFPLCLSVHFIGVLAQFLSKEKGGGGDRGVPRVGLFNLYRVHFKRYQESWGVPLVATHHPLGSYSASVH